MSKKQYTPCKTCGKLTTLQQCDNCWEVENRLEKYLQSPGGQKQARNKMPLLDDWVDGHPDAWDYEAVLTENEVVVEWSNTSVDGKGVVTNDDYAGWSFSWKPGDCFIGETTEEIARKAAALFVSLWLRGVSASFAEKLLDGFIVFLERQEGITKGVMVEVGCYPPPCLHLHFGTFEEEDQLLREFGLKEGDRVGISLSKQEEK